jgi:hypothetical protein
VRLASLVVRCQQYLPLYHPITLPSLLDLAIAASMVGKTAFAERAVLRADERLSAYLSEMEHNYLFRVSMGRSVGKLGARQRWYLYASRRCLYFLKAI